MTNNGSADWLATQWDLATLGSLFSGKHVRVQLRLPRDSAKLKVEVRAGSAAGLASLSYPPWYWHDERRVSFDVEGAKPATFSQMLQEFPNQIPDTKNVPSGLVMPTVVLPDETALVLDGNHRFLAMLLHEPNSTVVQVGLRGLKEPSYLPDLRHWFKT